MTTRKTGKKRKKYKMTPERKAQLSKQADKATAARLKISLEELYERRAAKAAAAPPPPKNMKERVEIEKQELRKQTLRRSRDGMALLDEALAETGHNPLLALIEEAQDPDTKSADRIRINTFLSERKVATLKAIDIQQETKMNVSVQVQSFADAYPEAMKRVSEIKQDPTLTDEMYEEFEEVTE